MIAMKTLLFGVWLTLGADASTTHYALATQQGTEVVIPSQNPYVIDAIVVGEATAATLELQLHKHRHPKVAKILGWTIIGIRAAVVVHNITELRK